MTDNVFWGFMTNENYPPFVWRSIAFEWREAVGSQRAQYEGSVVDTVDIVPRRGLWFSVTPQGDLWIASCYSPLGMLARPCAARSKEDALDEVMGDSRAAAAQLERLMARVPGPP